MLNLNALRATLTARLATLTGLNTYPSTPASPEVPCVVVHVGAVTVHDDLSGGVMVAVTIEVLVQLSDWPSAQTALNGYCGIGTGGNSIVDAIEGTDTTLQIDTIEPPGTVTYGEATFGAVAFHGRVLV